MSLIGLKRNLSESGSNIVSPAFKKKPRCTPDVNDDDIDKLTESERINSSSSNECSAVNVGVAIPTKAAYMIYLQQSKRFYEGSSYCVVADCDPNNGKLKQKYVVVTKLWFKSPSTSTCGYIYTCCCEQGIEQHERLRVTSSELQDHFVDFYTKEAAQHCLHASAVDCLIGNIIDVYSVETDAEREDINSDLVEQLCLDPLLVGVVSVAGVYLLQYNKRSKRLQCSCNHAAGKECCHKKKYETWCEEQDVDVDSVGVPDEPVTRTSDFKSISSKPIPYPFPQELQQVYIEYELGLRKLPCRLVPDIPASGPNQTCPNGAPWDDRDPVDEGWVTNNAIIHKEGLSVSSAFEDGELETIKVYHRFCTGSCRCKLYYDGQRELLFNLNNRDMIHYSLLIDYLHHMLEGRNPLAACHRSYQHSHMILSGTKCISLPTLRLAWNAFARLLVIPFDDGFVCPACGPEPRIVICDGTTVGCNKTLLNTIPTDPVISNGTINGTKYKDRTLVTDAGTRKLLNQYADGTSPLSPDDYTTLLSKVRGVEHLQSLADFMECLHEDRTVSFTAPTGYKQFFKDVASPSPACALLQCATEEHINYLMAVLNSNEPIFKSEYGRVVQFLQRQFPVLFALLTTSKRDDKIPSAIQKMLFDFLKVSSKAYNAPGDRSYTPADNDDPCESTSFFPSLPKLHRNAKYAINKENAVQCSQDDLCRKFSRGHPTLSPGIFTVYCPHGVCYGFELMRKYESPQVPFNIFKTRFNKAPEIIVYDNACKLHTYCLNREPDFFRKTVFVVDRMHWYNHRSCSSGYCMDTYKARLDIKSINSQVNEQANAGLARIKAQLAYMLPDNFIFHAGLFLALRNSIKIKKMPIG